MNQDIFEPATVYRSSSRQDCLANAFVLQAIGIPYAVRQEADEFTIAVGARDAGRAAAELEAYRNETRDAAAKPLAEARIGSGWVGVLSYAAVLMLAEVLESRNAFGANWFEAGKLNAGLVRRGELWRVFTALTLHSGLEHLVANLVIGGLMVLLVGQALGSGIGWFAILISAAFANLTNAWLRSSDHTSIGSSTAVFTAIGILAAHAWRQRRIRTLRMERWVPLVGGALLLGFLGTGGERTDIGAHVLGFLCGAMLGALSQRLPRRVLITPAAQLGFGIMTLAILAAAWTWALLRGSV